MRQSSSSSRLRFQSYTYTHPILSSALAFSTATSATAAAITGGDDTAAHVLPHQLQELVVLAGLDPAASAVLKLLGLLHQRIEVRGTSKLFLDDLLHVANFFRAQPLAVTLQLQQQAVDQQAAAVEAEAAAEEVKAEAAAATAAEAAAEAWQEEEEEEEEAADAGDGGPWGAACEQDMLAQHIALHRPAA